jgi:uroporphyrinogen decarboxylase
MIYHGDGNMWPFMEDIIEMGFEGFNPIQPQCMDIAEVKRSFGDRICLVGNIDCRDLLCYGTEAEVERVVKETIDIAARGGGYMLHSSNSLHHDVRPENYVAMVRAGQKYGLYPV